MYDSSMLQSDHFPPQHRGQMENGHFVTSSDQMEKLKNWKKNKNQTFWHKKDHKSTNVSTTHSRMKIFPFFMVVTRRFSR